MHIWVWFLIKSLVGFVRMERGKEQDGEVTSNIQRLLDVSRTYSLNLTFKYNIWYTNWFFFTAYQYAGIEKYEMFW